MDVTGVGSKAWNVPKTGPYALAEILQPTLAGPEEFEEVFGGSLPILLSLDLNLAVGDISHSFHA